jgi:hypothetical protein
LAATTSAMIGLLSRVPNTLKERFTRYSHIMISVIGRTSGQTTSIPV